METSKLERALSLCKGSLLSVDFVPALTHFFFINDGNHVVAYNDTTAVVVSLDGVPSCGIKGDTLLQLLPTLGKEVEFQDKGKGGVELRSGKLSIKLPTLPSDQNLFEEPQTYGRQFDLSPEVLHGLELCCETVSDNAVQRALSCLQIVLDSETVTINSSNDVALTSFSHQQEWEEEASFLILGSSCRQLIALCNAVKPENNPIVFFGKDWLHAKIGEEVVFYARLVTDVTAPNFERILDDRCPDVKYKVPAGLAAALMRAKVLTSKDITPLVKLKTLVGALEVSANGSLGSFIETFPFPKGDVPVVDVSTRPEQAVAAISSINTVFGIGQDAIAFGGLGVVRLVATVRT